MLFKLASNVLAHVHCTKLPGTIDTNADDLLHDLKHVFASRSEKEDLPQWSNSLSRFLRRVHISRK